MENDTDKKPDYGQIRMQSRNATRQRHASMEICHRRVKINKRKTSKTSIKKLYELGWATNYHHNYLLTCTKNGATYSDISKIETYKDKNAEITEYVPVWIADHYEPRDISILTRHIKDENAKELKANIKSLHTHKENGRKVGAIRYSSGPRSTHLKEYGVDYKLLPSKNSHKKNRYVTIAKVGRFPVTGGENIPDDMELASAVILFEENEDIYIDITGYRPAGTRECERNERRNRRSIVPKPTCGIDFNIYDQIVTSDGDVHAFSEPVSEKLKRAQRKHQVSLDAATERKAVGEFDGRPRASRKCRVALASANLHRKNQIKDKAFKEAAWLLDHYEDVFYQDDDMQSWIQANSTYARELDAGITRQVMSRLREAPHAHDIGRFEATTKACGVCGHIMVDGIKPGVSEWICDECLAKLNRQVNAAEVVRQVGLVDYWDDIVAGDGAFKVSVSDFPAGTGDFVRDLAVHRVADKVRIHEVHEVRRAFQKVYSNLATVVSQVVMMKQNNDDDYYSF